MLGSLPSVLTLGNLVAGFAALPLAAQGLFLEAAFLVALAAGLDLADGALARLCSTEGEFGSNLDSLADVVSFGAAPAFALYLSTLQDLSYVGLAACAVFLACGAARLARFPLVKKEDCYLGLPIPPAGLALVLLAAAGTPPVPTLAATLAFGALMISRIPFPSVKALLRNMERPRPGTAVRPTRETASSGSGKSG